jgi:hypothetical protein
MDKYERRLAGAWLALAGFLYALPTFGFVIGLLGGGHGFNGAFFFCFVLILVPGFGLLAPMEKSAAVSVGLWVILIFTMGMDAVLIGAVFTEQPLQKAVEHQTAMWVPWAVWWFGWQIPLIVVCVRVLVEKAKQINWTACFSGLDDFLNKFTRR